MSKRSQAKTEGTSTKTSALQKCKKLKPSWIISKGEDEVSKSGDMDGGAVGRHMAEEDDKGEGGEEVGEDAEEEEEDEEDEDEDEEEEEEEEEEGEGCCPCDDVVVEVQGNVDNTEDGRWKSLSLGLAEVEKNPKLQELSKLSKLLGHTSIPPVDDPRKLINKEKAKDVHHLTSQEADGAAAEKLFKDAETFFKISVPINKRMTGAWAPARSLYGTEYVTCERRAKQDASKQIHYNQLIPTPPHPTPRFDAVSYLTQKGSVDLAGLLKECKIDPYIFTMGYAYTGHVATTTPCANTYVTLIIMALQSASKAFADLSIADQHHMVMLAAKYVAKRGASGRSDREWRGWGAPSEASREYKANPPPHSLPEPPSQRSLVGFYGSRVAQKCATRAKIGTLSVPSLMTTEPPSPRVSTTSTASSTNSSQKWGRTHSRIQLRRERTTRATMNASQKTSWVS
jgi:hypothetical protein